AGDSAGREPPALKRSRGRMMRQLELHWRRASDGPDEVRVHRFAPDETIVIGAGKRNPVYVGQDELLDARVVDDEAAAQARAKRHRLTAYHPCSEPEHI